MKTVEFDTLSGQMRRLVDSGLGAEIYSVKYNDAVISIANPTDSESFIIVFVDSDRYLVPVRKYLNCRTYEDVSEAVRYINAADRVMRMIDDDPVLGEGSMAELFDGVVIRLKDYKANA